MNGDVTMIGIEGEELSTLASFKEKQGTGQHFAHPVISDGVMYIRHGNSLMAYQIK